MRLIESMNTEVQALLEFVQSEGRICPLPDFWNRIWERLPARERVSIGDGWEPRMPLILGHWHDTSDEEKRARLAEHILWADFHGELAAIDRALRRLPNRHWHHGTYRLRTGTPGSPEALALVDFAHRDRRICPVPHAWNAFQYWWVMDGGPDDYTGPYGHLPWVLSWWWHTSAEDKRNLLKTSISRAEAVGQLKDIDTYLRKLPQELWYHEKCEAAHALPVNAPTASSVRTLVEYSQSEGRVCPIPIQWDALFKILRRRHIELGLDENQAPPNPLILGGWWPSSDADKRRRLEEHIIWADHHGVLSEVGSFLRNLPDEKWYHEWDV